ncbi:hypothetical protein HDU87_004304 [Geranomyces variabilis]|uniref:Velvet domain-containing protein n=1 Tax=Geranomyces variabilis TaxID=109894 RepID=A0AAD5XMP0_9FUNG|nr:hypothetical protein HDU87_004304 [Geranomyces variabilis]
MSRASVDMDSGSQSEQQMHQQRELRHEQQQQQQQQSQPRYQQRPPPAPEPRLARDARWDAGSSHGLKSEELQLQRLQLQPEFAQFPPRRPLENDSQRREQRYHQHENDAQEQQRRRDEQHVQQQELQRQQLRDVLSREQSTPVQRGENSFKPEYIRRRLSYHHVLEPNHAPPIPHQEPPYPPHLQIKPPRQQSPSDDAPTTLTGLAALRHQQSIDNLRLKEQQVLEQKEQDERHTQQQLEYVRKFARRQSQEREAENQPDGEGSADVSENSGDSSPQEESADLESIPHYALVVRQQPQRARMSGNNNKDRRPVDPTPM